MLKLVTRYSSLLSTFGTIHQHIACAPSNATTVGSTTHIPFFVLMMPTMSGHKALPLCPTALIRENASACMLLGMSLPARAIAAE